MANASVGNMKTINGDVPRGDVKMKVKQVHAERWCTGLVKINYERLSRTQKPYPILATVAATGKELWHDYGLAILV